MALGSSQWLREAAGALYAFDVPFVSATLPSSSSSSSSSGGASAEDALLGKYDNLVTTVPDRAGQVNLKDSLQFSQ